MDGMRILLIVVGLGVIVGFLLHGLWTIRKNNPKNSGAVKNKPQAKHKTKTPEQSQKTTFKETFDEFGVSAVRVVASKKALTSQTSEKKQGHTKKHQAQVRQAESLFEQDSKGKQQSARAHNERKEPSMNFEQMTLDFGDSQEPRLDTPQTTSTKSVQAEQKVQQTISAANTTEQISPVEPQNTDTTEEVVHDEASAAQTETAEVRAEAKSGVESEEETPEIISLYVSGDIQGPLLLQTLTELGFKYGDMNIFHRHESPSGKGPSLFCVANMFNPGTFDLDKMESFSTRGVALFMVLPVAGDAHQVFNMMHNAAIKIAEAMPRAAILDDQRNPISKQAVQQTYQRIREFEKQQLKEKE